MKHANITTLHEMINDEGWCTFLKNLKVILKKAFDSYLNCILKKIKKNNSYDCKNYSDESGCLSYNTFEVSPTTKTSMYPGSILVS